MDFFVVFYVGAILLVLGLAASGIALRMTSPFASELESWRREGILDDDQARVLAERFERALAVERRRRGARALGILGGITLGVGVILFFSANWGDIPRFGRLGILLAFVVAFLGAGYVVRNVRATYPALGHAFLLIGTLLFGASTFLVAQMYHWDVTSPTPFLIWALGALAVALVTRAEFPAGVAAVTFAAWIIYFAFDRAGGEAQEELLIPVLLALYGATLYAVGTAARAWLDRLAIALPMRFVGLTLTLLALLTLSFRDIVFDGQEKPKGALLTAVIVFAIAAAAGVVLLVAVRVRPSNIFESLAVAGVAALVLLFAFVPERGRGEFETQVKWYPLAFTFVLVALTLAVLVVGFVNDEPWLVSAAAVFAGLQILVRFVDTSWPALERSFAFLAVGGIALALAALLERRRKTAASA